MELTLPRREALAAISRDIAQVYFASVFIEPLLKAGDTNWLVVTTGLLLAILAWLLGLFLVRYQ